MLAKTDQRRAWVAVHLMTSPTALTALEQLKGFANGVSLWADEVTNQPVASLLAHRIVNDIDDSIDALLALKAHGILNSCRDLMEVAALLRDFRKSRQRLSKWLRSDDDVRRQSFGFGKVLYLYRSDPIAYVQSDPAEIMTGYTVHSRTLHPAPATSGDDELSHDAPDEVFGPQWVQSWTYEILKNAMAATQQMGEWMSEIGKDVGIALPDDAYPAENSAIDLPASANRWIKDSFPSELRAQLEAWNEQYRNRRSRLGTKPSEPS